MVLPIGVILLEGRQNRNSWIGEFIPSRSELRSNPAAKSLNASDAHCRPIRTRFGPGTGPDRPPLAHICRLDGRRRRRRQSSPPPDHPYEYIMIPGGGRFDIPEGEDKEEWIQFFEEAARATREGRGHRRAAATDVQPTASTVPRCCPTAPTATAPSTASPVDGIRSTASPTPMRVSEYQFLLLSLSTFNMIS